MNLTTMAEQFLEHLAEQGISLGTDLIRIRRHT
jgi:hypothetical protein